MAAVVDELRGIDGDIADAAEAPTGRRANR
jgi:hypothetical protein